MAAVPVHRANCACCNRTKRQKKRGAGLASLLADYSRSAGELVGVGSDSDDKDGDDSDKLYDGANQEDEEEMCEGEDGEADGTSSDDRRYSEDEEEGEEDEEEDEEDFWDCEEEDEDSSFYGCEDVPATPPAGGEPAAANVRGTNAASAKVPSSWPGISLVLLVVISFLLTACVLVFLHAATKRARSSGSTVYLSRQSRAGKVPGPDDQTSSRLTWLRVS